MTESLVGGASAAPLSMRATAVVASAIFNAARQLLTDLEQGRRVDAGVLRNAMQAAFGTSDATGVWGWKAAYDACEAATVLFLRRHGAAMRAKAASPAAMLSVLMRIASLLPTQMRRSEESQSLQQFSTPIGLAHVASVAAAITPADVVLEPSAGTGHLAVLAELAGASLVLNEFAESRAGILGQIFPAVSTTRFDAAHINDHLDARIVPSVVLMNPPFSAAGHVDRRIADAALWHVASALIHVVAGLLLPIWKRLPNEFTRVYRLQIDAGEYVVARKISAASASNLSSADAPTLAPDTAFAELTEGRTVLDLAEGLPLRRVRIMDAYCIELSGFTDKMRDRLRTYGLFGEIISWKLRMFVPTDARGVELLAKLVDQYAIERIAEREIA